MQQLLMRRQAQHLARVRTVVKRRRKVMGKGGWEILRERKRALINLFKHINLKPRKGNTMNGKLHQDDLELFTQRPSASKQTQAGSSGNGEDDDGEGDISEEQINLIYKKYALHAIL